MRQQRFALGAEPKIVLEGMAGDLEIIGREEEEILIESDDQPTIETGEGTLTLEGVVGDLRLWLPQGAQLTIEGLSGEARLQNIHGKVRIEGVAGDVELEDVPHVTVEGAAPADFARNIVARTRQVLRRSLPFSFGERGAEKATPRPDSVASAPLETERLTILRMLQEKKITAEEAEKLFQALGEG